MARQFYSTGRSETLDGAVASDLSDALNERVTLFRGAALRLLVVVFLLGNASGCLRHLGLAHSSLTPRTASLTADSPAVVRSQDDSVVSANSQPDSSREIQISPGHSFAAFPQAVAEGQRPQARLMRPQFGVSSVSEAPSEVATQVEQPKKTAPANLPNDRDASAAPVVISTEGIRAIMNRMSSNDMSEGRVLAEQDEQWNILNKETRPGKAAEITASDLGVSERSVPTQSVSVTRPTEAETASSGNRSTDGAVPTTSLPLTESPAINTTQPEPSMLDRLRGIYSSAESQVESRPRWRLPSPWSVFRDKEETDENQNIAVPGEKEAVAPLDAAVPSRESRQLLQALIAETAAELKSWPRQPDGTLNEPTEFIRRQQDLRLLYLIANRPGEALTSIVSMPAGEQEFWQELMLGIAQYRSTDPQVPTAQRLTNTSGQLRSAIRSLTPLTTLRVNRMDICSEIYSFGRIEPFDSNSFTPGKPILLYVEVENFATRTTIDGNYETNFDAQLQILADGDEDPIETIDLPGLIDESSSARFDYYQTFELNLPSHLEAGRYQIRLRLLDRNGNRPATGSVDFRIRSEG